MTEKTPGELYAAYQDRVLGYLQGKTGSREDAEDLCEAVFEKVYRALPAFDGRTVSAWIFTIARNTLTDYYRTQRPAEPLPEALASGENLDARLIRQETMDALAAALAELPQIQRDVIVLRYYDGYTLTDIARMTGQSYGMVKVYHKKALERLRRGMESARKRRNQAFL